MNMAPAMNRAVLRPNVSLTKYEDIAPKKQPAWSTETIFPWRLLKFLECLFKAKDVWKEGSVRIPPIMPVSQPNSIPPNEATAVNT